MSSDDLRPPLAARLVAAWFAGFGGLAFEVAVVRRVGLTLGNTAEAAGIVVAAFLLGLGVGGFVASRVRRPRGLFGAATAYAAAAGGVLAADVALGAVGPLPWPAGVAAALVLVAGPAVAMGVAFPFLFDGLRGRAAPGGLVALNLLGSVAAAWAAGNLLVPVLGLTATHRLGGACYGLAAVVAALGGAARGGPVTAPTGPRPRVGVHGTFAFASGLVVLGFEVLLLRRLPFFLEGFQPTLSGVLAACLLALAAGSAVGPVVARRLGAGAPAVALAVAGVGTCLGLQEWAAPAIGKVAVDGDVGLHLRIAGAALVSAAPALAAAGAVVPLSLVTFPAEDRGRAAGLLFLWQGLGSLAGAFLVGHALPAVAPGAFFAATPVAIGLLAMPFAVRAAPRAAAAGAAAVLLLGLTGVAGAGSPFDPIPPVRGSRFDRPDAYRPIEHRTDAVTTASVVYDRAHHSMVLFTDEFRAAYTGPGTSYMKVLGHLPFLLRDGLSEVAVIALGTGTTADAVRAWPGPEAIHVVEISPAVLSLVDRFAGDGPVPSGRRAPFAVDPRTQVHVTDGRRWLATRAPGSLDLVTMEPLLPYAPGTAPLYSAEFYALVAGRLRPGGLCVQWVPTHAMPRAMFETLLATFADAFASTSVWLVDQSTLLVGSAEPHLPPREVLGERLAGAPDIAARTLHEAGIVSVDDLLAAHVGTAPGRAFARARRLHDDVPFLEHIGYWGGVTRLSFLPDNLGALEDVVAASPTDAAAGGAEWRGRRLERLGGLAARARAALDPTGAEIRAAVLSAARLRAVAPRSVLLHGEETLALRAAMEFEARRMAPAAAAVLARRHVERDLGSAALLALTAADRPRGSPEVARALEAAIAVDPTAPERSAWAFAWVGDAVPEDRRSPLEDLAVLPSGAGLVEMAAEGDARSVAVRSAFGVRVGRALVAAAAARPLTGAESAALRSVADPALVDALARAVTARGGDVLDEVARVWRRDLPMPTGLREAAQATVASRVALAASLADRKGRDAILALADLLLDGDLDVRRAAAAALYRTFGDAVPYDPEASESERSRAAERLRALHNRRP